MGSIPGGGGHGGMDGVHTWRGDHGGVDGVHTFPVSQSSSQAQVRRVSAELETCLNGDGDEDGFLAGA